MYSSDAWPTFKWIKKKSLKMNLKWIIKNKYIFLNLTFITTLQKESHMRFTTYNDKKQL